MGSIHLASTAAAGRRRPVRRLRTVTLAAALSIVVAPAGVFAQDEAGQAFCGLFTAKEIKAAVGSKVDLRPGIRLLRLVGKRQSWRDHLPERLLE